MQNFLYLIATIAFCCLSVLCIYLIIVLVRVRKFLISIERDIKELTSKAIPVFDNLEYITEKIKNVAENIDEQISSVKYSISAIKEIADNFVNLERRIQNQIEGPMLETISTFAAFFKGIRNFFERLRS